MSGPNGSSTLRELHALCGCTIQGRSGADGFTLLSKDGCAVAVEHLTLAIECDTCRAFTATDIRADIIAVRRCEEADEWLVLEMKGKLREKAGVQARTAVSRLGRDPMFPLELQSVHVFFVIKIRRKSDYTIMRNVGKIEAGRWSVTPRIVKSGSQILC